MICPHCGTENPAAAKFCNECGAALAASTPREQRKVVTVLFCDVSGSTALGERLDPETLRDVMGRYFEVARAAIERHGGTVEKFIGDAVMAVFGVPTVHEDDALRAVRAACELRDRVDVDVRIGVNTGEVVTGGTDTLATGDAVNVAARLEQAAGTGEILIGERTYALVRDSVDAELLPPLEAKGKSQPLTAYRLRGVAGGGRRRDAAPMVGRTAELDLLARAYERSVHEHACHLFTVLGTAGIGKSRLVAEFLAGLQNARVVAGRCLSYGEGITYWPVVEVLKQLGTPVESVLREGTTPPEIAWAVRKTLEEAALDAPLVVVFDDIQWGEPTFLDLIEHIADLSRGAPILLLCMARPELLDLRQAWGGGKLNATTVLLEPLPREAVDELLRALAGDVDERIRDAADGNPLFVEEMVELARTSDGDLVVPPTIQALLTARLDSLPPAERAVLERGAVEGQVFHRSAVAALAPEEGQVDMRLVSLVRKELVRPDRAALLRDDAYRFRHLLIRDAAYDALPKSVRIDLHDRFATWLEEHGTAVVELDEIVGYHLEQAAGYAEELGRPASGYAARAARRLAAASMRAHARSDVRAALNLARRAHALWAGDDAARRAFLPHLGSALYEASLYEECVAVLGEAVEQGDALTSARARSLRARVRAHTSSAARHVEVQAEIDRAVGELEAIGDEGALAEAYANRGRLSFWAGQIEAAKRDILRARAHARRVGELRIEADAVEELLVALDWDETPREEVERLAREVAANDAFGPKLHARALMSLGRCAAGSGRFDEGGALLEEARRRFDELGHRVASAWMSQCIEDLHWLRGDFEVAAAVGREVWERLGELDEVGYRSTSGAALAELLARLGRDEEAAAIVAEAERISPPDDFATLTWVLLARGRLAANAGELDRAVAHVNAAIELLAERDDAVNRMCALICLAEVLVVSGRRAEAEAAVESVGAIAERRGSPAYADRARAVLATMTA